MPEQYRCDSCGKTFASEGDAQQHVQTLHGGRGVGGYSTTPAGGTTGRDEPGGRVTGE